MLKSPHLMALSRILARCDVKVLSAVISIFLCWGFLLTVFQPSLILSPTVTAGGDTASHYLVADYLTHHLLPQGRLMGWYPGWYAGMPMFQSYFIPPYLVMAILSYFIGLQVAFKIVTISGVFLLPVSAYLMMRLMGFAHPTPSIAATFSLAFLFMENNSMWGGNIPSTLAGEFSYSISLSITLIFFGLLYRGVRTGQHIALTAVLFALVAMTHVYTVMWAILVAIAFLPLKDMASLKKAVAYIVISFPLAFFLTGFWTIPMIFRMAYTTPYAVRWYLTEAVIPPIIWPFLPLAAIGIIMGAITLDAKVRALAWALACNGLLFAVAPHIGFVDARFIPFAYIMVFAISAYSLGAVARRMKGAWMMAAICGLAVIFWVSSVNALIPGTWASPDPHPELLSKRLVNWTYVGYIPYWIEWNYEGFEGKPDWGKYMAVQEFLRGDDSSPRAKFEHSEKYNAAGSVRAFESIPMFSGRPILEGLLMHAIVTPPFAFYVQSELSVEKSCPFWKYYPCTRMDLDLGTEHLRMFNTRYLIARSESLKVRLSTRPEWRLAFSADPYEVWELKDNPNMYVTVPANKPYLFRTDDWKRDSYAWFAHVNLSSVHLVFTEPDPGEAAAFAGPVSDLDDVIVQPQKAACNINEDISAHRIAFTTDCPGIPHIISISNYPSWKALTGEKIHLVSPSFMLVVLFMSVGNQGKNRMAMAI